MGKKQLHMEVFLGKSRENHGKISNTPL
jgi:hypothetical protein